MKILRFSFALYKIHIIILADFNLKHFHFGLIENFISKNFQKNIMSCSCNNFKIFAKEFFSFGQSSGSIFTGAIGLFRTFQRISATRTFSASFSNECYKMFKWALNIFEVIRSIFFFRPLYDTQLFYIFSYAIPLTIVIFITAEASSYLFFGFIWIYYLALMIGVGIGFFGINLKLALILTLVPIGIIFIISFFCFKCDLLTVFKIFDPNAKTFDCCPNEHNRLKNTFSLTTSLIVLTSVLLPVFIINNNNNLGKLYYYACSICVSTCFIIELIYIFGIVGLENFEETKSLIKLISFAFQIYPLLIVPATEYFSIVVQNEYKNDWRCIIGYVFFSLLLPIALVVFMIIGNVSDVVDKYHDNYYAYIEIVDIIKQVVYAIVAAFDIPWACVGIEIGWLVLIFGLRPFVQISEYVIQAGNSLIIIIETVVCIVVSSRGNGFLNFATSVTFVVLAFIPAIAGFYVYFIVDFDPSEDDSSDDDFNDVYYFLSLFVRIVSPFAMLIFGFFISRIINIDGDIY